MTNFSILLDEVAVNLVTTNNPVFHAKASLDFRKTNKLMCNNCIIRMIMYNYYEL